MVSTFFSGTRLRTILKPFLPMLALLWVSICIPSAAEANGLKKVLVLHSYHQGYLWTDMIQEGFSRTLKAHFPKVEIYTEYMNTKRQTPAIMTPYLVEVYRHLYSNVKFDVIAASDNNALDFLLKYRDSLFPGAPVVFCGVNDFFKYLLEPDQGYTGVREDLDIASTIGAALKLHPGTKKVALVTDATETGQINLGLVRKVTGQFPSVQFIELHALTAAQLRGSLKQLGDDTVVLALAFFRDPDGKTFSAPESMEFILSSSSRPVYTVWDFYMTSGTVGGKLLSGRLQGENAAKLAARILQGEKAGAIPVIESPTEYMFDYAGLQKFGISESRLPEGALVTGKPDTLYSRYGNYLWSGTAVLILLVSIIAMLLWNVVRRREGEDTFRKLFEDSSEAILLIDGAGVFVECNQSALDLLKMTREQFLLLPPSRISPEFQPNGRRSDEAAVDMIALTYSKGLHRFDWTCVNAEGGEFIVEVSLMPITIKGQTMLHTTWRDITERKREEEKLQLSERKYASIFNLMPDMVGITRVADGVFIEVNAGFERWSGWKSDEVLGKSSLDLGLWSPETRAEAVAIIQERGYLEGFEFKLGTKTGEQRDALMYLTPIVVQGEKCLYFMARDVTELKRAVEDRIDFEKQLLHAQKLESLGVLAGGIAHDFNNLLMAIMGNADLALMRLNPESPAVDNLKRIEQASARAADLAKQMLAYSGKGKFIVEHLDISRLAEEMLHMLEVSISKKAVLRFNLTSPIPSVEADATQLRQIIMNLVINASEAIGDKSGVIAISTGCMECDRNYLKDVWLDENLTGGLYVYLEIADTGCGMDKETLSKLFDPFFTTKFTGRGLGMAAVLGIVRGHKGAIKVYSEPGKGTSFKVLLPASNRPAELFNSKRHTDDWQGSGTVLLVDDEETVRAIGSEMLRELGFQVITADDGSEGVAAYKQHPDIAFVILDLTMPHMDGEQCFRELRQLKPDVKVIMSSGFSEQEVAQKFVGKGLAGFIQKPYKLSMLKDVIRGAGK